MSTQDPYGSPDQPREPRTGSSADPQQWQSSPPPGPPQGGYPGDPAGGYGAQPPAGHAGYDRPAPRNGMGVAALVLGVLALVTGFFLIGGLLGLVAIVLGAVGSRRAKRGLATNRGMAIAGIVLGVLGVLVAGAVLAVGIFVGVRATNCNDILVQEQTPQTQQQYQQCLEEQLGVAG